MSSQDIPLEVVLDFVFPFLTDGELIHLRLLSHQFERILQSKIRVLFLKDSCLPIRCLGFNKQHNPEALFRLMDKSENVEYLKGISKCDHEFVYEICSHLPKLRRILDLNHCVDIMKIVKLCPQFESLLYDCLMTHEEIVELNPKRFKHADVYSLTSDAEINIIFHYLEDINWCNDELPDWTILQKEITFRIEHNRRVVLEKQSDDIYPEILRIRIRCNSVMDLTQKRPLSKNLLLQLDTSSIHVVEELAFFCEVIKYNGSFRELLKLPKFDCQFKELDLFTKRLELDWIVPKNSSLTAVIRSDQEIKNLQLELYRKVLIQILHRVKSLQIVRLSLPFNILVLFGNDLKPNLSHYNLEKHVQLDWIPLNYYASVSTIEAVPQLILKKRLTCPLYKEPEFYETIDFSVLDSPIQQVTTPANSGFGLFDD